MRSLDFSVYLNPPSRIMAMGSSQPLTEMSTRNFPGGVRSGRRVKLTISPPSVSRLPRKYESLDDSHPYGLPKSVTGIDLPFSNVKCKISLMKTYRGAEV
jgi:hypothetical protein